MGMSEDGTNKRPRGAWLEELAKTTLAVTPGGGIVHAVLWPSSSLDDALAQVAAETKEEDERNQTAQAVVTLIQPQLDQILEMVVRTQYRANGQRQESPVSDHLVLEVSEPIHAQQQFLLTGLAITLFGPETTIVVGRPRVSGDTTKVTIRGGTWQEQHLFADVLWHRRWEGVTQGSAGRDFDSIVQGLSGALTTAIKQEIERNLRGPLKAIQQVARLNEDAIERLNTLGVEHVLREDARVGMTWGQRLGRAAAAEGKRRLLGKFGDEVEGLVFGEDD